MPEVCRGGQIERLKGKLAASEEYNDEIEKRLESTEDKLVNLEDEHHGLSATHELTVKQLDINSEVDPSVSLNKFFDFEADCRNCLCSFVPIGNPVFALFSSRKGF